MINAFNKKLSLLALTPSEGRAPPAETARAIVWADVFDVGVTTKFAAEQAGQTISICAVMRRAEFRDYTHAEYEGRRYKIIKTGSAKNPLHIKLTLERG